MKIGRNNFRLKIDSLGSYTAGPNVYLADGATFDGAWYTNQDRHPEEKVKTWKRRTSAERRATELQTNGVACHVEVIR